MEGDCLWLEDAQFYLFFNVPFHSKVSRSTRKCNMKYAAAVCAFFYEIQIQDFFKMKFPLALIE